MYVDGITGGRERSLPVASFRWGGARGSADPPPRIVKCKSFALSVSSKGSLYICNVLSDDMDVLHNCLSRITITNSEK